MEHVDRHLVVSGIDSGTEFGEPYVVQAGLSVDACAEQVVISKEVVLIVRWVAWVRLAIVHGPKAHQEHVLCPDVCAVQVLEEMMLPCKLHFHSVGIYIVHALFSKIKGTPLDSRKGLPVQVVEERMWLIRITFWLAVEV